MRIRIPTPIPIKLIIFFIKNTSFRYNNDTENYELLSSLEVSEIQDIIHIYYENNKPLVNTYESHVEYEYDDEYDEEYISDANDVYWFYNEMYGEKRLIDFFNIYKNDKDPIKPLLEDIDMFIDGQEQFDDMTLMYLMIKDD